MSDILLETKTHIPRRYPDLVNRPHLVRRLNDGIVQNHCLTLISAPAGYGKSMLFVAWFSQVDFPVAWLCKAYAWVKAYVDPSGGLDRILQNARQVLTAVEDDTERQHLTCHLVAIQGYTAWVRGNANEALVLIREALAYLPEDEWTGRAHLLNIQGLAQQYLSQLHSANQSLDAAIKAGQRSEKPYESFLAQTNQAFLELLQGRLYRAYALCQHVLNLADQPGIIIQRSPVLANVHATLSMVQCEWNQVDSAVFAARQAAALGEQWRQVDTLHYALTCLSEALCARGDIQEGNTVNKRVKQLAANASPWFFRFSKPLPII